MPLNQSHPHLTSGFRDLRARCELATTDERSVLEPSRLLRQPLAAQQYSSMLLYVCSPSSHARFRPLIHSERMADGRKGEEDEGEMRARMLGELVERAENGM